MSDCTKTPCHRCATGDKYSGCISEIADLKAQLSLAVEALKKYDEMNFSECRKDHHGNCQEHYVDNPCLVYEAHKALTHTEESYERIMRRVQAESVLDFYGKIMSDFHSLYDGENVGMKKWKVRIHKELIALREGKE